MPIYNFGCFACGLIFEKIVPTGTDTATCPKCGWQADTVPSVPAPFQWGKSGGWK